MFPMEAKLSLHLLMGMMTFKVFPSEVLMDMLRESTISMLIKVLKLFLMEEMVLLFMLIMPYSMLEASKISKVAPVATLEKTIASI
jgi:hypothetical protein